MPGRLTLSIVRHATAQERGESLPDFERPLVKKGAKEAAAVARHLAATRPAPDLMVSSFANRAIETAHIFAKAFRYPLQRIILRDVFYGSPSVEDLVREIRKQPDEFESLMLFGHDPVFSELAAHLVQGFRASIPKAGVVTAEFAVDHWADLASGSGRLVEFTAPALLKEQRKKARNDLEKRLARSMAAALAGYSRTGARAFKGEIRRSARKTVKGFMKSLEDRPLGPPSKRGRDAA